MRLTLFLMFTIIPMLETWLIVKVGATIGATETVLSLVAAGLLGSWLGRRAGFSVLREVAADFQKGLPPADRLVEAALVLVGAVLLITPGYLSDFFGLLLFIAPFRRFLAPRVKSLALRWLMGNGVKLGPLGPGPGFRPNAEVRQTGPVTREPPRFDHPVS